MPGALTAARKERNRPGPRLSREGVDWYGFLERDFPHARRHDLGALTAYAAYRRAHAADQATDLGTWEGEGGATR